MTALQEAAERALKTLELMHPGCTNAGDFLALRQALNAEQQKPIATVHLEKIDQRTVNIDLEWSAGLKKLAMGSHKLYIEPQSGQRQMTNEEIIKAAIILVQSDEFSRENLANIIKETEQ